MNLHADRTSGHECRAKWQVIALFDKNRRSLPDETHTVEVVHWDLDRTTWGFLVKNGRRVRTFLLGLASPADISRVGGCLDAGLRTRLNARSC